MKFFEALTFITIIISAIVNTLGLYCSLKSKVKRGYKSLMFANIGALSWIWFVIYWLRISDRISMEDYFVIVNPLIPAAFIVVWILPTALFLIERRARR